MIHRYTSPKSTAPAISATSVLAGALAGAVAAAASIGAIYLSAQAALKKHQSAAHGHRLPALPEISRDTDDIVVVYEGGRTQPISDLVESGTLSDGESGEDYAIIGIAYAGDL